MYFHRKHDTVKVSSGIKWNETFVLKLLHNKMFCIWGKIYTHYNDVIMATMASKITGISMVCSVVCFGADQGKHQSSASLAFMRGIHRWPVNSPHKGPVMQKMFPIDDVVMNRSLHLNHSLSPNKYQIILIVAFLLKYTLPAKNMEYFLLQRFFLHFCGVWRVFLYLKYIPNSIYYFWGS